MRLSKIYGTNIKIKVINPELFLLLPAFCSVVTANFAEQKGETMRLQKFPREINVTQKSFEYRKCDRAREKRKTVDRSEILIASMSGDCALRQRGNRRIAGGQWESSSA